MRRDVLTAEMCLRDAWPAPYSEVLAGWMLRAGRNGYNRANSVWTGRFTGELHGEDAIHLAEAFYRDRRLPARFQVIETAEPAGLPEMLAARGYETELECSTLAKSVVAGRLPDGVTLGDEPQTEWRALYELALDPARAAELPSIMDRLPRQRGFILAHTGAEPAAVALAICVGRDVAVECVFTRPEMRGGGAARRVMIAAEAWAAAQGARRMLLIVVDSNEAAKRLYARLGYERLTGYAYWFKSVAP